jgi:hypothetical protein
MQFARGSASERRIVARSNRGVMTNMRSRQLCKVAVLGVLSSACGDAGEAREPGDPLGVTQQAAAGAPAITWFRWSKGEPARRMERVSTHACGLSMVRGELAKDADLFIRQGTGFWELLGIATGSNLLQADAVCVPLSAFRVNAGQVVSNGQRFFADLPNRFNATVTTDMTPNSAGVLTRVKGAFNGAPERVWIDSQWPTPTLNVRNGTASGTHTAGAYSLNFGLTGNVTPRAFSVRLDLRGGDIIIGAGSACPWGPICSEPVRLDRAFCYLSSVSGDFNGAEEWAQVYPRWETGNWHFNLNAGSTPLPPTTWDGTVYAEMTCLYYDQTRTSPPVIR